MKNLLLFILLTTSMGIFAQGLTDQYAPNNETFNSIIVTSNMYNGEFMIRFGTNKFYLNSDKDYVLSYSIEAVSFPFVPAGFFTTGDGDLTTNRNLVLPSMSDYGTVACGEVGESGFGWNNILYHKTKPVPFKNRTGEAFNTTLASNSYNSSSGYSLNNLTMYIPHTVLKLVISIHDGENISAPILYSIPYLIDNTRGRLRYYPYTATNTAAATNHQYDFLIIPHIKFDINGVYGQMYNTTSNSSWAGAGTINYFPPINNNGNNDLYPQPDMYDEIEFYHFFPVLNDVAHHLYPAPYCVPDLELRNSDGTAHVGYDDNGVPEAGAKHYYYVDRQIDLTEYNTKEKIIYNPSETIIELTGADKTLVFPAGYTFKTINGLFPTVAMVNAADPGNLYRDKRKVNVSNSGFPLPENQHTSVYHVKSGSTLIIEPCVSIIDAIIKVEPGGVVKYDADRVYLTNSSIVQSNPSLPGTIITNYNYNNQVYPNCKQDCYNIDNYSLYDGTYNTDILIKTNTIWNATSLLSDFNTTNNTVRIPGKITVKSGNTLTIDEGLVFEFSETGGIIVEKGAKLIVNGTQGNEVIFTSACNNMWEGIEVWGDKDIAQYANPHSATQQGYIELNYTKVSNAITGVLAGERDKLTTIADDSKAGGLIKAYNSTFENNATSIEFLPYQQFISSTKLPNYSLFETCSFKTTALLQDQYHFPEQAGDQIVLNKIHFFGNNINNCTFYTDKSIFEPAKRGVAIKGHNSSLRLLYSSPSSFEGFTEAILIENSNDAEKVHIDNCTFDDNIHAIVLDAVSYTRVYRNTIDVPNSENFDYTVAQVNQRGYDNPVGIYIRYCQMNDLQENRIIGNSPASSLPYSYGIITNSTTGDSDNNKKSLSKQLRALQIENGFGRIYNNTINKLSYAIQGELNNGESNAAVNQNPSSFLPQKGVGEQFKCNTFTDNVKSDVFLTGKEISISGSNPYTLKGEFRNQGICTSDNGPAGNSFNSPNVNYNLEYDNYTALEYFYTYYNDFMTPANNFDPTVGYINKCMLTNYNSNSCPDLLSEPCNSIPCLKDKIVEKASQVEQLEYFLLKNIDGGIPKKLLDYITLESDDFIHGELIKTSPYLSDEVLLALINKEKPIEENFFLAIIMSNCGLSDTIITALESYELSSSAREEINASIKSFSERSMKYAELNNALFELNIARMDLINYGLDNVSESNNLEVLSELQLDKELSGKYRELNWLMQCGLYDEAENLLADIALLEGDDKSDKYKISQINLTSLNANSLSIDQYTTLNEIIYNNSVSSFPTQSLLKYYAGKKFERKPIISKASALRKAKAIINTEEAFDNKLTIFPNPSKRNITISFKEAATGKVQILSVSGTIVSEYNIFSKESIKLDISSIAKGIYIVTFVDDNNSEIKYSKLIIQ